MRLEQVQLHHIRMQLTHPFETSFGRIYTRDSIVIEAFSDGLIGIGECVADRDPGYSYESSETAWLILKDFIIPLLMKKEIDSPYQVRELISSIRGNPMAKAGIEMAIWDLFGKSEKKSLKELFGGTRYKVPVGVSIGIQNTHEQLLEQVENRLNEGYQRIKIKIKPGRDVFETELIRKTFPDVPLQVDANSAYTLKTIPSLYPLDDLDLLMIEQPLDEDDLWDHRKIQKKFKTAICLDESIISARHARQAIEMEACRIINIKAGRVGGLAEAKEIHDLCFENKIPVWCGGMLETGIGRASNLALASLPGFVFPGDISATDRYYNQDITNETFALNSDSTINVPNGYGLGVTLNKNELNRVTLNKTTVK